MTQPSRPSLPLSRRRLLAAAGASVGGAALTAAVAGALPALVAAASPNATPATPPTPAAPAATPAPSGPPADALATFRTRPDVRPPVLTVKATRAAGRDPVFLTPRYGGSGEGVMIYDAAGELIWLRHVPGRSAVGLQPVTYQGEPALWWWEGVVTNGLGDGEFVIVDDTYREIARIRAVARPADLHELTFTPDGDALFFALDLVTLGGQPIVDYLVQQVDVPTGRLRWQWRASDHIGLDEMVEAKPDQGPWDFVHLNSIDVDPDGDLLISARHTDTLYKVSRHTGDILWRLGGPRSDFQLAKHAVFHRQHFARWQPDGTISLFDNATSDPKDSTSRPAGMVLRVDEAAGTARLVRRLDPPVPVNASSQGDLAIAPDGSATVGWGSANLFTSYDPDGNVTLDGAMPRGFSSYRAFRSPWQGRPRDLPILTVAADDRGAPGAWVSWNGATDVVRWRLLAGTGPDALEPAGETKRAGFETALPLPAGAAAIAVAALDGQGRELARSEPVVVATAMAAPRAG
ncbi:MAG: arylsulfotransferase family protein [Chloroflexota bacterium]